MTDESVDKTEETVTVDTLEGLLNGWQSRVARHEYDGTPEQYHAYQEATQECIEQLGTVIESMTDTEVDTPTESVPEGHQ